MEDVSAAAAVDQSEGTIINVHLIIAGTALHHIRTTAAIQCVVAKAAGEQFGSTVSNQRVVRVRSKMRGFSPEVTTEDDVSDTTTGRAKFTVGANKKIVEPIAIDVASTGHRIASKIGIGHPMNLEAILSIEFAKIDR